MLENQEVCGAHSAPVAMYQECPNCKSELVEDFGDAQSLAKCTDPLCGWQLPTEARDLALALGATGPHSGDIGALDFGVGGMSPCGPTQDQWDTIAMALAHNEQAWELLKKLVEKQSRHFAC